MLLMWMRSLSCSVTSYDSSARASILLLYQSPTRKERERERWWRVFLSASPSPLVFFFSLYRHQHHPPSLSLSLYSTDGSWSSTYRIVRERRMAVFLTAFLLVFLSETYKRSPFFLFFLLIHSSSHPPLLSTTSSSSLPLRSSPLHSLLLLLHTTASISGWNSAVAKKRRIPSEKEMREGEKGIQKFKSLLLHITCSSLFSFKKSSIRFVSRLTFFSDSKTNFCLIFRWCFWYFSFFSDPDSPSSTLGMMIPDDSRFPYLNHVWMNRFPTMTIWNIICHQILVMWYQVMDVFLMSNREDERCDFNQEPSDHLMIISWPAAVYEWKHQITEWRSLSLLHLKS